MFNKAAHERSLPCSSAPIMTPRVAAQQPHPTYLGRKQRGELTLLSVTTTTFRRRSQCSSRLQMSCRAEVSQPKIRHPVAKEAKAFAPATIANLGPGFDWMGCAVEVSAPPPVLHESIAQDVPAVAKPIFKRLNDSRSALDA